MLQNMDRFHLREYIDSPCEIIDTSGEGDGEIIKFRTFYIKVYETDNRWTYTVLWYQYGNAIPFKTEHIDRDCIREWAECHNL